MNSEYSLVVLSNDRESLAKNLMSSDALRRGLLDVQVVTNASSASAAYNRALDVVKTPVVICLHQDVYLPPDWDRRLSRAIALVEEIDPDWAIIAPIGMSMSGEHVGQVWSTGQGANIGRALDGPVPVQSVDELMIVLRRDSGVRFDDTMPDFHLYGTDIVQNAISQGKGAYACQMPVVHNDRFHDRLGADFSRAYHFVRRKWPSKTPIRTTVLKISKYGLALMVYRLRAWYSVEKRRQLAGDIQTNPSVFSKSCGWEQDC